MFSELAADCFIQKALLLLAYLRLLREHSWEYTTGFVTTMGGLCISNEEHLRDIVAARSSNSVIVEHPSCWHSWN